MAEVEYTDGEHETMLDHLDHMHHETRSQTIARLEAALKVAKAGVKGEEPLATHEEPVMREVTDASKEPIPAPAKNPRRRR